MVSFPISNIKWQQRWTRQWGPTHFHCRTVTLKQRQREIDGERLVASVAIIIIIQDGCWKEKNYTRRKRSEDNNKYSTTMQRIKSAIPTTTTTKRKKQDTQNDKLPQRKVDIFSGCPVYIIRPKQRQKHHQHHQSQPASDEKMKLKN